MESAGGRMPNMHQHALAIDVFHLKVTQFGSTHGSRVSDVYRQFSL